MAANFHDVELARLKIIEAHVSNRARLCYFMVAAGIACLLAGIVMLVLGITDNQSIWLEKGEFKVTAGGFGAVTMLASVGRGYFAYLSRPLIKFPGGGGNYPDKN